MCIRDRYNPSRRNRKRVIPQCLRNHPANSALPRFTPMTIAKFKPETEFATPERCHIVELINLPEDADCSIARARVQPGVVTQLHSLRGVTERYVIVQG